MMEVIVGLGANLQQPLAQLQRALVSLQEHPQIRLVEASSFYSSKPMGPQQQPDYVNAVAVLETSLDALSLLDALQAIEKEQGRERLLHWGPRTLDLDILFYGSENIGSHRLVVPHPGILQREFVLVPLAEIRPQCRLPNGQTAEEAAQSIDLKGLTPINTRTEQTDF